MSADKLEYTGRILEDGRLHIVHRSKFDADLKRFAGKDVEIVVQKKRKWRSSFQNRYYWGIAVYMVRQRLEELGHEVSKEECHEFLKQRFNYSELVDEKSGEIIKLPRSTTDMTTTEFMEYLAKIQQFAAETLDIVIPDPSEDLRLFKPQVA